MRLLKIYWQIYRDPPEIRSGYFGFILKICQQTQIWIDQGLYWHVGYKPELAHAKNSNCLQLYPHINSRAGYNFTNIKNYTCGRIKLLTHNYKDIYIASCLHNVFIKTTVLGTKQTLHVIMVGGQQPPRWQLVHQLSLKAPFLGAF